MDPEKEAWSERPDPAVTVRNRKLISEGTCPDTTIFPSKQSCLSLLDALIFSVRWENTGPVVLQSFGISCFLVMSNNQGSTPRALQPSPVQKRAKALTMIPIPNARPPTVWTRMRNWIYFNVKRPWIIFSNPIYMTLYGPRPFHVVFMLLWPFPWKYPLPPPLSVQSLLDDPGIILRRRQTELNYVTLRKIERFCLRDTPLRSLYRLYECVVAANEDEMMQESQYWFHRQTSWFLVDIPDPQDSDPIRYAILASLVDALVHSFNHKIKLGLRRGITNTKPFLISEFRNDPSPPLERYPGWTQKVGPLSQKLELNPDHSIVIPSDVKLLPAEYLEEDFRPFAKRNIVANFVQLYNI